MKKRVPFFLLIGLMLGVVACGNSPEKAGVNETTTSVESRIPINQLIVGTMQLEGTEHAVTAEQAEDLLPLWKAYRGLVTSDTAAQAEVQALLNQIQSTMTSDQLDAIQAMQVSTEQISAWMEEYGLLPEGAPENSGEGETAFPGGGFGGDSFAQGGPGEGPDGGGFPRDGFREGNPNFPDDISPDQMRATAEAMQEEGTGPAFRMGSPLITPLIAYLETKAGG